MYLSQSSIYPLPTLSEVRLVFPELVAASGVLVGSRHNVMTKLNPAWGNIDFEPKIEALGPLDRAFVERQIERSHRDYQRESQQPYPWTLVALPNASLVDWRIMDTANPYPLLSFEVPVLTVDRCCAVLRGQLQGDAFAEDFEHWLIREEDGWRLTT